uniref:Fam-a protein n=1 Tax=Rhabditophanes sp. KR3021 TaxID=114890 RepID=A0AC35TI93_9BILA
MNTNLFYLLLFFAFSINCAVESSDKSGTLIADENKPTQIASPKPSTKNDLTQNNQTNSKNTIATTTPTVDFQPELVSKEYQLLMQNLPTAETYLPKFDFKRKDYTKFYDHNEKGPRNGCLKTHHRKFYDFTHGVYRANPGNKVLGIKCYYSCQYDVNVTRVFGPYKKIGQITKPSCDVTRTKCLDVIGNPIYADVDLYLQKQKPNPIVEMPDLHPNYTIAVNGTKYSVHMIYIDSVGEFTFKRTMPKTDKLIKDMYKAFEFKYLHKVGENTGPNEKAFLMSK